MAVTIDGRELLYAEMFSAVIDSNIHDRLALNWQTPFKRSGDGVLGCLEWTEASLLCISFFA